MGVQLSTAEKMRATTGPWQELAKLFVDDFPVIYSLMKDRARAKDFQLTLACFSQIVEVTHPSASNGVPILKTNHSVLPKLLSNKGAVDDALKSHLASVWNTFKELVEQDPDVFTNADKHLRGVQTFAPVEMVAVTVMISTYSGTRNNRLLLGDITALREALREHFVDLRLNASVWKFVWDYIEDLEAIRGAVNGTTVDRNLTLQQHAPSSAASTAIPPAPASQTVQPKVLATKTKSTKTKSSATSPPQEPAAVKKELGTSLNVRPAKRKRVGPGPPLSHQSSASLPNGNVISSHFADGNVASREHVPPTQPTGSPNAALQSASQQQSPLISTSYSTAPSSMTTALPRTSTPVHSPAQSPTTTAMTSRLRAKRHNASPSVGPSYPPSTTLPESSPPKQKKRKSITTRPTPAQVDGAIDLTSHTELEEERQTLLSAFKGSSVKQAQIPNSSSVSTAPMRRHPVVVHDLEEDAADENNPYARYRKSQA
jgi:hypothetical protein